MSAGILTVCLTVGMLAGTFASGTAEQVSGAITGFTSNDFLKCYGTSIRNNYGNGNTVHLRVQMQEDYLYRKVGCVPLM